MTLSANYWLNNSKPNHAKAFILANGCMLAFSPTNTTAITQFQQAIGADSYQTFPATGWTSGAIVFKYNSGTLVLCMSGSTSINQAMVYGLSRVPEPSVIPTAPGQVSSFYNRNYQYVQNIKNYMVSAQQANFPINMIFSGYSLGHAFARMIATDILLNDTPLCNFLGGYSFGGPSFCSLLFDQVIDQNKFWYSYRHRTDPVPTFQRRPELTYFTNSVGQVESRSCVWSKSGIKMQMRDGEIVETRHFDGDNRGLYVTLADIGHLTSQGNFVDHPLSAYIDYLDSYLRRGRTIRAQTANGLIREVVEATRNVEVGSDPTQEDQSDWSGDGGVQDEWNANITPPGNFMEQLPIQQAAGVGTGRVVVRPTSSYYEAATSRVTTQRGDGHAKKACLEILEKIAHIRHHDSGVTNGVHRGTNFLFGSNTVPENLASSIDTLEDTLRRLIN